MATRFKSPFSVMREIADEVPACLRVEVRPGRLKAYVNGKLQVDWQGDIRLFQRDQPEVQLMGPQHVGFGTEDRMVDFHRVELWPVGP